MRLIFASFDRFWIVAILFILLIAIKPSSALTCDLNVTRPPCSLLFMEKRIDQPQNGRIVELGQKSQFFDIISDFFDIY